ncbi:MAG: hypothetical protein HQM00_15860 [Magnetococcales bacterium]|nr:hypothetical protein [Magnetococcales bacterium]
MGDLIAPYSQRWMTDRGLDPSPSLYEMEFHDLVVRDQSDYIKHHYRGIEVLALSLF